MARSRSAWRNGAEFVLARGALLVSQVIPYSWVPGLTRLFGRLLFRVLSGRRRVVAENLRLAMGDEGPDPDALARASFASLCRSFIELARLPRSEDGLRARVEMDEESRARLERAADGGPVVIAGNHFGAYEMAAAASALYGLPVTTLARPLDNPWLERWLRDIRTRFGQRIATNRGGLRELLRELGEGRNVAVLVDLNHRKRNRVFVDFFGVPAATAPTAALLARRAGCPLVAGFAERLETPGRFRVSYGEPLLPDPRLPRDEDVLRLMQAVTDQLEARVRAAPEQWLWTHRRWKTREGD